MTGAADTKVHVHDITAKETIHMFSDHTNRVKRIATAPMWPNTFWSAAEDGLIRSAPGSRALADAASDGRECFWDERMGGWDCFRVFVSRESWICASPSTSVLLCSVRSSYLYLSHPIYPNPYLCQFSLSLSTNIVT